MYHPMTRISILVRLLCWFRGVAPAHLAKHPNELALLTTQGIAMLLPMMMAAVNGWNMARESGAATTGCVGVALFVAFLIYGTERVLLQLVGSGGFRSIPSLLLRLVIALCLALLLGEGFVSGFLFKPRIEEYFRRQAEAELTVAATVRDEAQKAAEAWRAARLAPFQAEVLQRSQAVAVAVGEQEAAQKQELAALQILLDEEEGRAASGLQKRGGRYTDKTETYHKPAVARLAAANARLVAAETSLGSANAELRAALKESSPADEKLRATEAEYQRKVANVTGQKHHDLGSRITAMLTLAWETPVMGVIFLVAVMFFVCVDLGPVLLKSLGRKSGFDLEEADEIKLTQLRLRAEIAALESTNPQIAEMRSQTSLRGAISQSALEESRGGIQEAVTFFQEVAERRLPIIKTMETAQAKNLPDLVALCRRTLEAIDHWAERGLNRCLDFEMPPGTTFQD